MYQQITLIGNLGTDPEMRHTPTGVPVASFSLAVNRSWTGQDGQKQDKTTWFRVTVWNKQAEIVTQYLTKGRQVLVVGEMEDARAFTDRDGNMRASLEVRASSVRFLGQAGGGAAGAGNSAQGAPAGSPDVTGVGDLSEEDIPF